MLYYLLMVLQIVFSAALPTVVRVMTFPSIVPLTPLRDKRMMMLVVSCAAQINAILVWLVLFMVS